MMALEKHLVYQQSHQEYNLSKRKELILFLNCIMELCLILKVFFHQTHKKLFLFLLMRRNTRRTLVVVAVVAHGFPSRRPIMCRRHSVTIMLCCLDVLVIIITVTRYVTTLTVFFTVGKFGINISSRIHQK